VQVFPVHENDGKRVLWPMLLPWVETTEPRSDTAVAAPDVTVNVYVWPYAQSLLGLSMVKVGLGRPLRRYEGVKTSTRYSSGNSSAGALT
jgi:hypothetical protein